MKKREIAIVALIIALLGGALLYQTDFFKGSRVTQCTLVEVETVAPILFEGKVEPVEIQEIYYNQTNGDITEVKVGTGDVVTKGQDLIAYSNTDRTKALAEQQRLLARAEENKTSAKKDLDNAYYNYNRIEEKVEGYKNDLKNLSEEQKAAGESMPIEQKLNAEEARLETQKSVIDSLKEKVKAYEDQCEDFQAQIKQYESDVNYTERANIGGTVVVNESLVDNPMPSGPIICIYSDKTKIIGEANEYDYSKLKKESAVEIKPVSSNEIIGGTVTKIDTIPQNLSNMGQEGMSQFQFTVTPAKKIQVGFSVQISLPQTDIILPSQSVKEIEGKYYVFQVADDVASQVEVTAEERDDGYLIQSGIQKGDFIIDDVTSITDGMQVSVKK